MSGLRTLIRLSLLSSLSLGLLLLFSLIYSLPLHKQQLVVHRQLDHVPEGYIQIGKPNPNDLIQLTVGLVSPNMTQLEKRLDEISNVNHTNYGKYLSKADVEAFVRPDSNVTMAINAWLTGHNIKPKTTTPAGNRLTLEIPVNQAENLLNASFNVYSHILSNQTVTRVMQYSVPKGLTQAISFIHPISHFPSKPPNSGTRSRKRSVVPSEFSKSNTTSIIRRDAVCTPAPGNVEVDIACRKKALEQYHIPLDMDVPSTNDEVVILAFDESVRGSDVAYRSDVELSKVRLEIVSAHGGDNPANATSNNAVETDIAVQMVLGVAPNSRITVISSPVNEDDDTNYLDAFEFLLQKETMSTVVSLSDVSDEASLDTEVINSVCHDIMQLTARGTTVVVASGDGGVTGTGKDPMTCNTFHATFPTICPHALSVGATQIFPNNTETAAAYSGGGFSNKVPMPSYQTEVVGNYLKQLGDKYSGLYNPQGRGFPDVSILGGWIHFVDPGASGALGTAVSAPLIAGVIAAMNDHRRAKGQGPLGYIHPMLYANTDAFTDITQGSNPGCNTDGFPAMGGWDPVNIFFIMFIVGYLSDEIFM
ncbi:hypothetical protein Clacol_001172 [Clathrus columnatus]|uniref:Peptidase S53 domain-containing protein n=1 Tax=Clathrus columnatus TaxID=1419009 RepID=A0AAV4ZXT0_9AGAM|nr:hypothetical protein Clacol_001172 [Clathrus columnatus]